MKRLFVFIFTILIFTVSVWTVTKPSDEKPDAPDTLAAAAIDTPPRLTLTFSKTDFFYEGDIEVEIIPSILDAEIYYTTDGSEPTEESELYAAPLMFDAGDKINCVVLKAMAINENTQTRPIAHTYFIGKDVFTRFNTLIFSVSTNDEYLYDYDTGIFVPGRLRDEYVAANPKQKIEPPAPANFNLRGFESERPVYVEVFTKDGERVVTQAAGLRLSGGWSRAETQKSLRLIARNMYEPGAGKFHYAFFPGEVTRDGFAAALDKYDTIVLRNGANDRDFGMLRNEVASNLARDAGFNDVTPFAPASVFLNGEYYGFAWAQIPFNEQYLQDMYGSLTKDFEVIGDGDSWYNTDNIEAKRSLQFMNKFAELDLTNDEIFAELEAMVDIDNMLLYYAFETYMDNNDWPNNNMKRWRYIGPAKEDDVKELDGRWRYIMYDLDWTLGLYDGAPAANSLNRALTGSPLLKALLERRDIQDRFAAIICGLSENVITKGNVQKTINEVYALSEHEIDEAFKARKYSSWTNIDYVLKNHAHMIDYAERRGDYFKDFLKNKFGYTETFKLNIIGGEVNYGAGDYNGASFFVESEVRLKAALPKFAVFDHYILNGMKKLYEDEVIISGFQAINGAANLSIVSHMEYPPLIIKDVYSNETGSGITLKNPGNDTISTKGLFLSDTKDNLLLWEIPAVTVLPGGEINIAGKGSTSINDLFKIQFPYRINPGKVIILSDGEANALDCAAVW